MGGREDTIHNDTHQAKGDPATHGASKDGPCHAHSPNEQHKQAQNNDEHGDLSELRRVVSDHNVVFAFHVGPDADDHHCKSKELQI